MNLLCVIPNIVDGTSLYRAIGPLQSLAKKDDVRLAINVNLDWGSFKWADAVFLQRPYLDVHLEWVRFARLNKKPVWLDFDDNLFAVPLCNSRYLMYNYPQAHHSLATLLAMADVVTVSTEHMAGIYRRIVAQFPDTPEYRRSPEKIIVVANAYDRDLQPDMTGDREPREKLVVWRGSGSHAKDLWTHTKELATAIGKHTDWRYEFIGEPFWLTLETIKKVAAPRSVDVTASMDPIRYFEYLKKLRPALVIVPLEDQSFNRSKSNIAWIEATAAGAVTLAPAWDEWQRPGVITYSGPDHFYNKLDQFLTGCDDSEVLWRQSRDCILTHWHLDAMNDLRKNILNLLGKGPHVKAV